MRRQLVKHGKVNMSNFQISNSKKTLLESYIFDNKENIINNQDGFVMNDLIFDFENNSEGWRDYCNDEQQQYVDGLDSKKKDEYLSQILDYINANYDYQLTND